MNLPAFGRERLRPTASRARDVVTASVYAVALVGLIIGHTELLAQGQTPWRSTTISGLSYRETYSSPCGGNRGAKYHYHQFKNNGPTRLSFLVEFTYTDADGRTAKSSNFQNLDPGRETSSGGSWQCAMPGTVQMRVQLDSGGPKQTTVAGPGDLMGVKLDQVCIDTLRDHARRLEAAGAAQSLLAWSPLTVIASGRPIEVSIDIARTEWTHLGEGIGAISRLVYSRLATDAMLHADLHQDGPTKRFWRALSDRYSALGAR